MENEINKLTRRHKKFIVWAVKLKSIDDGAFAVAGASDDFKPSDLIKQPMILDALQKALSEANLNDTRIAKKVRQKQLEICN